VADPWPINGLPPARHALLSRVNDSAAVLLRVVRGLQGNSVEHNRGLRRLATIMLVGGGAGLMLLSVSVRGGLIAFALGVLLELVGRVAERRQSR